LIKIANMIEPAIDAPRSTGAKSAANVTLLPFSPRQSQSGFTMPRVKCAARLASHRPAANPCGVTLAEKQQQLVADYAIIDDPQERLAAVVDRARRSPPLPATERTEANRVKGCVSLAWIAAGLRDGRCQFRSDADSPLVRGLLLLLCDFYSGATPADVVATEPALLEELGLAQNLSPTRLNGLRSVRAKIRDFAATVAA
jgi:cysteine desulfuration protein SufE